jgi:molybdate transport system substrate-binding protein
VPEANPGGIVTLADLARPGVKIVAAGDSVPITKYADQVIARLADEPGYPGDFSVACARNVVSKEESVKAVVAKIQLGEGDAAIVYVTDALATNDVVTIEIPASANILATYAGVVIGTSPRRQAAHAFLDWLRGPEGAKVLRSLGFLPP